MVSRKRVAKKPAGSSPKRGISAYLYFCNEMRPVVKSEIPNITASEVLKELGKRWRLLSDEEKVPYNDMAAAGKTVKKVSNKKPKKASAKKQPKKASVKKQPKKNDNNQCSNEYTDEDYDKINEYLNKIYKNSKTISRTANKFLDIYIEKGHLERNNHDDE